MILLTPGLGPRGQIRNSQKGFTYPALMISAGILTMTLAGILATHVFGLRMCGITQAKIGANVHARKLLGKVVPDLRAAQAIRIGQWNRDQFVEVAPNQPVQGNAVQLYMAANNTNDFIRYYVEPADNTFRRYLSSGGNSQVLANGVSNSMVFAAVAFDGSILTNKANNAAVKMNLEFLQLQNPALEIGPGNFYQSYQLTAKVTHRVQE
ncbi:MAG: hypothetical protein AB1813_18935 [Verrucomicrobiota bacterium]|jgi:hypothetical protein